ncbi:MAG: hypothetical protein WC204_06925 [Elusimicrobiales bacterium]|jgi:hypothetical protein
MKTRGFAVILSLICAGLLAAGAALPGMSQAQRCIPPIQMEWTIGPDQYYSNGYYTGIGEVNYIPGSACECQASSQYTNFYIDGQISGVPDGNTAIPTPYAVDRVLPEGEHTAAISFTAVDFACGGIQDQPYSFNKIFYVDTTKPAITISKPQNNVVVSTADPIVAAEISDSASKLGSVSIGLSVGNGVCWFKRDFSGRAVYLRSIEKGYCDAANAGGMLSVPCTEDIGTVSSFNMAYDLRDYVDFSSGQDCGFIVFIDALDRVGNHTYDSYAEEHFVNFMVDQAPPNITITNPKAALDPLGAGFGMIWSDPDAPVITGSATDLSPVAKVWLTIKDETANRFWNGAEWHAATCTVNAVIVGSTTAAWEYEGLRREVMRGGIFTITAYAQDKFGHVSRTEVSGKHKKRYDLGEEEFTGYILNVKELQNTARSEDTYSFIMKPGEDVIGMTAEILPEKLAAELSPLVKWNVAGINGASGMPAPLNTGSP